jgi:tetratricopeptide (TPR) repeat protein
LTRTDRAEHACTQQLELLELQPAVPNQQKHFAAIAHQLGAIAQARGDLDGAESWYLRSRTINEEISNNPDLAATYHQLGVLAQERGDLDDAEAWYHRSLTIERRVRIEASELAGTAALSPAQRDRIVTVVVEETIRRSQAADD